MNEDPRLQHTHLRIDALHQRIEHLEAQLRHVHEHVGLGLPPARPALLEHEVEAVRRLLADGHKDEALQLHHDLTGQGITESLEALQSLSGGA